MSMTSQTQHTTVPCPSCGQPVLAPCVSCGTCGVSLTGPDAVRLWQVDQQLAALGGERRELLARLRAQGTGAPVPPVPRYPASTATGASEPPPGRSLSGQQVILGLGALLLISAAALFTVVVWLVVGLVGQALILVTLTALAVTGSRLFARKGLPAGAETAAVIAVGLTLVGANAAHARGLADLDRFSADGYWAVALLVCGGLFAGFDRCAGSDAGDRGVWTYPPAAACVLSLAPWCLLSALDVTGLALQAGVGVAAVVLGVGALVTRETAHRPSTRAAALLAGGVAVAGAAVFGCLGLALAYDVTQTAATRYAGGALLVVVVCGALWTPLRWLAPVLVVTTLGLLIPAALLAAPYQVDAVAAIPLGAASIALLRSWPAGRVDAGPTRWGWSRALAVGSVWIQVVLFAVVAGAFEAGTSSVVLAAGPVSWWAPLLPATALLAVAATGLWLHRSSAWVWAVQAALAVTTWSALVQAPAIATFLALLGLMVVEMAVAILTARRAPVLAWLLASDRAAVGRLVEILALTAGVSSFAGSCAAAVPAAVEVGSAAAVLAAVACYATAVLVFVYAAQRDRLPFAYLGSLLTSTGSWLLLAHGDVSLVEAYTVPPAVLLALVGAVTHRRARAEGRRAPGSMLTWAPALAVALGPSTLYAVEAGGTVRTALVVAAGVACLVGGFGLRLKAPVLAGGISLGVVAVTQGGPYVAYVPGWVTIGAAGALLLAVGLSWESAIVAGRRSTAWFSSLR